MRSFVIINLLIIVCAVFCEECPEHEKYFSCGANCQTECSTLGELCRINHFRCPDGCYCEEGFARNNTGNCIPISQCPQNLTEDKNSTNIENHNVSNSSQSVQVNENQDS